MRKRPQGGLDFALFHSPELHRKVTALACRALLVGAPVLAACGRVESDEPQPPPFFVSGSRLRARILDGGDGAVVFQRWHDAELNLDCTFQTAEDGRLRCLPWDRVAGGQTRILYTDAACTSPVRTVRASEEAPRMTPGDENVVAECSEFGPALSVYELGAEVQPGAAYYLSSGTCTPTGLDATFRVHALGPKLPPEGFVLATEVSEDRGPRLQARVLAGEDGSRELFGVYDGLRDEPCSPPERAGTALRCLPSPMAAYYPGYAFADSACTEEVALASPSSCGGEYAESGIAFCAGPEIFEIGPSVATTYGGDTCLARSGASAFVLGAPIADTAFAPLVTQGAGQGRLRARYYATESNEFVIPFSSYGPAPFQDTALDVDCSADLVCESVRCVPSAVQGDRVFTDPACSRGELVRMYRAHVCGAKPNVVAVGWVEWCAGTTEYDLYETGEEIGEEVAVYFSFDGACTLADAASRAEYVYYRLAQRVTPDSLPLVEERLDVEPR